MDPPRAGLVSRRDEIHAESPERPAPSKLLPHRPGIGCEPGCVGLGGREPAAEIDLTTLAAEDLLMRGKHDDLATRQDVGLGARAGEVRPDDPFLDDATERQIAEVPVG